MQIVNSGFSAPNCHTTIGMVMNSVGRQFRQIKVDFVPNAPMEWQMLYSYNDSYHINYGMNTHTQDYYEIIVHLRSSRKFMSENTVFEAEPGDCILFAPGDRHMGIESEPSRYIRYYLLINPALIPYLPDGELIERLFERRGYPNVISFEAPRRDAMLAKLERYQKYLGMEPEQMMGLRITVMELLHELCVARKSAGRPLGAAPPLLTEILAYIHSDYAVIDSVGTIAGRFGISASYLSRIFKEWLHTSPYRYLTDVRLDEARRMLGEGKSVTDACFASGFTDCSHFIVYFKRAMGVTPAKFRSERLRE